MSEQVKIVTVDVDNVDKQGFFCYKSKPKSVGYGQKRDWLRQRLTEGMRIKILYEGKRSVGFIEYTPGEFAWRAVHAPGYQLVHCIWVVGKAKGQGYGRRLLDECLQDARQSGAHGVAAVTTSRVWLAHNELFLQAGFEVVDQAPPSFELLVQRFDDAPLPAFPTNWPERLARYGPGLTVFRADQCPYIEDAREFQNFDCPRCSRRVAKSGSSADRMLAISVASGLDLQSRPSRMGQLFFWNSPTRQVVELGRKYGVEARVVRLTSAQEVQISAPTAYGVFAIVYDGELVSYHYLGRKEIERLVELLTRQTG